MSPRLRIVWNTPFFPMASPTYSFLLTILSKRSSLLHTRMDYDKHDTGRNPWRISSAIIRFSLDRTWTAPDLFHKHLDINLVPTPDRGWSIYKISIWRIISIRHSSVWCGWWVSTFWGPALGPMWSLWSSPWPSAAELSSGQSSESVPAALWRSLASLLFSKWNTLPPRRSFDPFSEAPLSHFLLTQQPGLLPYTFA